jgi:hypothetical protein
MSAILGPGSEQLALSPVWRPIVGRRLISSIYFPVAPNIELTYNLGSIENWLQTMTKSSIYLIHQNTKAAAPEAAAGVYRAVAIGRIASVSPALA